MKRIYLLLLLAVYGGTTYGQVVIDSVASSPHPSAMLQIKSGTKGLLVPRISTTQMYSIPSPAVGLLVYNVDDQSFYYYKGEVGWVMLISEWDSDGIDLPFNRTGASAGNLFGITQLGLGSMGTFGINNINNINPALIALTNGSGRALSATNTGTGTAIYGAITSPASVATVGQLANAGIGSGLTIQLTNASNGARGLDVLQAGVGPGVFATSAGGNALWGITSSISAAGVIGDNTFGEAVVGRNRGGEGVGAVVGRNDSSGYGTRGFNTKDGIGALGQAGISGGTGIGGRFENVNAANPSDALQGRTNGVGNAGHFTSTNNSSGARGVRIDLPDGVGGTALNINNGKVVASFVDPYVSNATIDDLHLIVRTSGNLVLSTTGIAIGTIVYVTNFSGNTVVVTNTQVGNYNILNLRAQQFIFFGGSIWTPVQ